MRYICFEWIDGDAYNERGNRGLSLGVGKMNEKLNPVHPGEVLLEEFLKPMGLSQNRLSLEIGVHPRHTNEIVLGKRRITADTALRLARYFGTSPQFWMGLQNDYDLDVASDNLGADWTSKCGPRW
jgi:antitoxin HigA-1